MSLTAIKVPDTVMHCGNEISCVINTDLIPSTSNLKIKCFLIAEIVYDSGTYTLSAEQALDPDASGNCKFFWQQYLWDLFENNVDLPTPGSTTSFKLQHHVKRYNFFAQEISGSPATVTDLLNTGPLVENKFAVRGGIPEYRFDEKTFFGPNGWNLDDFGKAFLDWRGLKPITRLTEDQWLYFMWQDPLSFFGSINIKYKVHWYRSDGTNAEATVLTISGVVANECHAYPAGFQQLALAANETATDKITHYKTWLEHDYLGSPILLSEVKDWQVDREYYEFSPTANFLNQLGVVEQITFRGGVAVDFDVKQSEANQYRDNSSGADVGTTVVYNNLVKNGILVSTGPINFNQHKQLLDFKASRKRWLRALVYGPENTPIRLGNTKQRFDFLKNNNGYSVELIADFETSVPDLF